MNETEWYSNRRTLVFSFLFAVGFHAALFAFVHHFPSFGKLKPVSPPKLIVHLCAKTPVKAVYDVRQIKPASFFPEVPPPPKKVAPKKPKKVIPQKPKKTVKPKTVKKSPKRAIRHVEKKMIPPPQPRVTEPSAREPRETKVDRVTESTWLAASTQRGMGSSTKPSEPPAFQSPPGPPERELAYPDYGRSPALTYPRLAQRRGIEGKAILKVLVSETGRPLEVLLEHSSGSTILDKAAVKAVKHWVFKPGRLNGVPIRMWVRVPVLYRLR